MSLPPPSLWSIRCPKSTPPSLPPSSWTCGQSGRCHVPACNGLPHFQFVCAVNVSDRVRTPTFLCVRLSGLTNTAYMSAGKRHNMLSFVERNVANARAHLSFAIDILSSTAKQHAVKMRSTTNSQCHTVLVTYCYVV